MIAVNGIPVNEFYKLLEVDKVKHMLIEEVSSDKPIGDYLNKCFAARPYFRDDKSISLQLCGWNIVLLEDGTWYWSDTSGG